MIAILALGFAMGLQHALEADHLAAVATLASRHGKVSDIVKHGLTWGLGHTLTLLALAGAAFLLGNAIPDSLANVLEFFVGVMLAGLGAQLLWKMWRERVHVHVHRHGEGELPHLHLHHHAGETSALTRVAPGGTADASHASGPHARTLAPEHAHSHGFRWRTLAVGLMHGMAGSAALLLLAMSRVKDPARGVAYILIFGLGTMAGMGILSAVISVPLAFSARFLGWANRGLQIGIGSFTLGLGVVTMVAHLR